MHRRMLSWRRPCLWLRAFVPALVGLLGVMSLYAAEPVRAAAMTSVLPSPEPDASASATTEPATAIEDTQDSGADARIRSRIADIFREIPAMEEVTVAVDQGVVRLTGQVPAQDDIARAEAIAGRVSGVVTIENELERDVSVAAGSGVFNNLGERFDDLVKFLPLIAAALLVAALVAAIGYALAGFTRLWQRIAPNNFLAELIASAIRFVFVIIGLVIALDMLGASALLGAVLGGAGVIGIALGFAMRDTIENYVASLLLSLRQPFRANDWVCIDDFEGRVVRLTSRATVLMTLDGNHLRIPNAQVFKAVILNYTRNPQRRFSIFLGIDADDDPRAARRIGRETLAQLPFVLDEPEPEARIKEVGDSNILIEYLGWIDQREADWFKAQSQAIPAVKDALEQAGFAIPEPIYRLRFDPRSTPLPLANFAQGAADMATKGERDAPSGRGRQYPAAASPVVGEEPHDVTPSDEVAEMVAAERRNDDDTQADLLDHSRPVE